MLLDPEPCSLNCSPAELLQVCAEDTLYPSHSSNPSKGERKKKKLITSMTLTQPCLLQLSLCSWLLAKYKPELAL